MHTPCSLTPPLYAQPLMEAGLDSIGAVELRNAVSASFGIELLATATFDYPSVIALAHYIAGRTGAASADNSAWGQPSLVAVAAPDSAVMAQQIARDLADIVSGVQLFCSTLRHKEIRLSPELRSTLSLCQAEGAFSTTVQSNHSV